MQRKIKSSRDILDLYRLYRSVQLLGAAAKSFDFEADFLAYKHVVEGGLEELRKLALRRLSDVEGFGREKLRPEEAKEARSAYDRAFAPHARKVARVYRARLSSWAELLGAEAAAVDESATASDPCWTANQAPTR